MRLNESVHISAPPEAVFDYLADPENYLRFMSGVTHWEVIGDKRKGLGARHRILIRVGAAEIGGLIEMVEWDEPYDIAWHSVTGIDQRGRWRIRKEDGNRSKVEFRFAYGVIGGGPAGLITEFAAAPTLRGHMRRTLQQLKRQVEHEQRRTLTEQRRSGRQATTA
jgi:uncharacterized membrane protein